jgi:hypothetical protein
LITPFCNGSGTFLYLLFHSLTRYTISEKNVQSLAGFSEPLKKAKNDTIKEETKNVKLKLTTAAVPSDSVGLS